MTRLSLQRMLIYLFGDFNDDLLKINISDGTLAWTYNAPTGIYEPLIVTDDAVYLFI